jgi:DNA invertase Pin-like site-specific DNA recombinase
LTIAVILCYSFGSDKKGDIMNIVLIKGKNCKIDIKSQQQAIIKYAKANGLGIDETEVENSDKNVSLDERKEFKGFLRSLSPHDTILIYDLHTLSSDVGELLKIFDCFLRRSISVHVCLINTCIQDATPAYEIVEMLSKFRELNLSKGKEKSQGRPKGRMSKSKFDVFRPQIIDYLSEEKSVNEISRLLHVSRTSLKDYINSRGLKELVHAKISLLQNPKIQTITKTKNVM